MSWADRETSKVIRREIAHGTPDPDGSRRRTIERADKVFRESFTRPKFRGDVKEWIGTVSHKIAQEAWNEMLEEFHLPYNWEACRMHMGHLLHFIETLAEKTI